MAARISSLPCRAISRSVVRGDRLSLHRTSSKFAVFSEAAGLGNLEEEYRSAWLGLIDFRGREGAGRETRVDGRLRMMLRCDRWTLVPGAWKVREHLGMYLGEVYLTSPYLRARYLNVGGAVCTLHSRHSRVR